MQASEAFLALVADLNRHLGVSTPPDEEGAICLRFEDGIQLHLCDSGDDLFALIGDTGIDLQPLSPAAALDLTCLCLQINFSAILSSRFAIGQSPDKTMVLTCSDHASRLNGRLVFDLIEDLLDKTRILRQMIEERIAAPFASGPVGEHKPGSGSLQGYA
jgi:hypothetical protein